jgi:peptidoglycan lytic transglycosylase
VHEVRAWLVSIAVAFALVACGNGQKTGRSGKQTGRPASVQNGLASWYGGKHHGGPTASGERFNKNAMTAAHRRLPMNTRVRVTNQRNGRSVIVRINDRGPYGRAIIDVSEAAARQLGMIEAGVVPVRVEVIK